MIRNGLLIILILLSFNGVFAQIGYKYQLSSQDGIDVKYKIVQSKKESPVQLCLRLKNNNEYDVNLKLNLEYSTGFTTKYQSGELEVCIPKKYVKKGKSSGLAFELNSSDKELFSSGKADLELIKFEIEQIETCRGRNQ
ncbi:MAG: hypothetical protein LBQ22_08480 [Bacteroidales bacterium]|jgi:hypothetical protein|nr:hypothetical protein [Bacteroidales bacterium]